MRMITPIVAEFLSTALMILFGVGVHCDTVLNGTKYHGSGHLFAITTWAFGISVCLFVFGGVCMNPAMALAQCLLGLVDWSMFVPYVIAEMAGGFAGAVISWFMYADAFRASEGKVDGVAIRNIFSTNPLINDRPRSFFIEAFDTTIFLAGILCISHWGGDNLLLVAICVGLLVWAIGMGLGGMTGFAMNQARDLGPRLAYQVLPIKGKVDNNWRYGLVVPGLAPFVGSFLAVALVHFLGLY
jgi:glycerol uptake facilitator protein